MNHISAVHLQTLEKRQRARLINSLSGFKSVNLIGTQGKEGQEGLSIVSSVVHLGSDPALLGMVMRPPVVPRHTYENIVATGAYSINAVTQSMVQQAHQTSARYPRDISEFDATELKAQYRDGIEIPFVQASPLQLHMKLVEDLEIKHNQTRFIIGQVQNIWLDPNLLQPDGFLNLAGSGVVSVAGLDAYHAPEFLFRLSYAKPNQSLKTLDVTGSNPTV